MGGHTRPLPIPPVYPGVIPYRIDTRDTAEDTDTEAAEAGAADTHPRLLAVQHRPVSVGSFGPPSTQTVAGAQPVTEEMVRDKFYAYWNRQKERNVWVPSDGHRYLGRDTATITQESHAGSQATLLSPKLKRQRWPRGSDFLGATVSFTLSLHGVWTVPVCVMQHGGVTFLLMYTVMLGLLGWPLLVLEAVLGQYSSLAPGHLYRHLCPLLAGLGIAVCLQAAVRALLDLGVLMWAALTCYALFSRQEIADGFFARDILAQEQPKVGLESLGELGGRAVLVLSVVSVAVFLVTVAGTRTLGKLGLVTVPVCFMLMVTLVIRSCLAPGAAAGVLALLAPDWSRLSSPASWMVAAAQVVYSLQLGLGAVTAYASYNRYHHNLVRDTGIILATNLVWVVLASLLVLSLLGVTHNLQTINLEQLASSNGRDPTSITGSGLWLAGVTLVEAALASLATGWLWAGLLFLLVLLCSLASLAGLLEVVTSSLVSLRPPLLRYKPVLTFSLLTLLFLVSLVLATGGGVHIYHLLATYIAQWPALLTSLLTLLAAATCQGPGQVAELLLDMSQARLHLVATSHLVVLLSTVAPALAASCLCYSLQQLAAYHLAQPLHTFNILLPEWAVSTGWSLALLPTSPVIFGAVVYLVWANRGVPRMANVVASLRSTERWHRAARIELDSGTRLGNNTSTA